MALIECTLQRDEPVIVPIGNERYEFLPDAHGRRVAEVWIESHVEAFLAVSHLYRKLEDEPEAAPAPRPPAPKYKAKPKPAAEPAKTETVA